MLKFPWKSLIISLIFLHGASVSAESILLKSPAPISQQEVEEKIKTLPLDMTWSTTDKENGNKSAIRFEKKEGKTVMRIQFENGFPKMLAPFENSFTLSMAQGKKVWIFVYGAPVINVLTSSTEALPSLEEAMGTVHVPRILEHQTPQIKTLIEIAKLIRDKRCVFYTGAGISAGVVPTMPQLMEKLQLVNRRFLAILHAFKNPALYVQPMDDFYKACLYGKPTLAHIAVRDIVQKKNWGLLTENLDLLHQRSGIKPLHHEGSNWLKSNVSEEDLKKIDYVIAVGLASDESGFLGWYKTANPKGRIVAINLQQPSYLGEEDLLMTGDVQQLLPLLREEVF